MYIKNQTIFILDKKISIPCTYFFFFFVRVFVKTKLYDVISVCQTSCAATQELFNFRQRRQKLVKTIFHTYKNLNLFFLECDSA